MARIGYNPFTFWTLILDRSQESCPSGCNRFLVSDVEGIGEGINLRASRASEPSHAWCRFMNHASAISNRDVKTLNGTVVTFFNAGDTIRTCVVLTPNQVRDRATLHPHI